MVGPVHHREDGEARLAARLPIFYSDSVVSVSSVYSDSSAYTVPSSASASLAARLVVPSVFGLPVVGSSSCVFFSSSCLLPSEEKMLPDSSVLILVKSQPLPEVHLDR